MVYYKTKRNYAGACERAVDITRVDATWNAARWDEGPTQGTRTEVRAPQRAHHRRGGPHKGPTQNTHRQKRALYSSIGAYKQSYI